MSFAPPRLRNKTNLLCRMVMVTESYRPQATNLKVKATYRTQERGRFNMQCPNCHTQQPDNINFCGQCGYPLHGSVRPVGAAPTGQSTPQTAGKPVKKRSKAPVIIGGVLLLAIILVFAGFALGLVPRFWTSPDTKEDEFAEYVDEANGIEVPDLSGLSESEATYQLEELGFEKQDVVVKYSYAVSDEDAGMVDRTEPAAGTKLKEGSPVNLVVLQLPNINDAKQYASEQNTITAWINDDPDQVIGSWEGEIIVGSDRAESEGHSNCDAGKNYPAKITIDSVDGTVMNADVSCTALFHLHDNGGNARHFSAADDRYEDVAKYLGYTEGLVMTLDRDHDILDWGVDNATISLPGEAGEMEDHQIAFGLKLYVSNDLEGDDSEVIEELLGDDVAKEFDEEEDAQEALAQALKKKSYLVLEVGQSFGSGWGNKRAETFRLSRAEEA